METEKEETQKLPKPVLRHLEPDERVLFSIKKKISLEKPKWLLVTDRRIIYLDEKVLGRYDLKALPYQKLEQVTVRLGIMSSEFIIEGEENIKLRLGWMNREEASKAINAIKDALNAIAIEPVSIEVKKGLTGETWVLKKPKELLTRTMPAYQPVRPVAREEKEDPLEKLKKLKELYDMGAISQEEYEEKRKKLLEEV
ncbi:PH domain-containing protein [Thermococcus waiotapuensis]|uniref:PH domain-containing protein n=1 Tax=Thermococcus waiotapuensis TaxID=90909 RepID=A0AAE4T2Q2_9EURY|nr:PH domain-containing protein [Thermococcus waiotapuensis]MDV3102966.1 PH domain-containing protein [Thermococcus waiotapuensis]